MRLRLFERPWLAVGAALILFFVANRGAYEGFFSDDDFDNLAWTTVVGLDVFRDGLLTPKFSPDNFRPVGHFFYRLLHTVAGFEFGRWVAVLECIHLLNVFLVFRLCKRLNASVKGAVAGAAIYAFHPALFAAFWKPMYVFDSLCGTLLLASAHLYLRDRLVLSFLAFWCAYKAKEVAIFFPLVLVAVELSRGRRWIRLAPFFAVSLSFGLQAVWANRGRDTGYTLRFTPQAFAECARFYAAHVALVLGPLLLWAWRDRRVWLALAAFAVLMGPHWFLPGRLFAVYLYVPAIAVAVLAAFAVERVPVRALMVLAMGWFAYVYLVELRAFRRVELTAGPENREFFEKACALRPSFDARATVYFEGGPPHMAPWGVAGVYHLCYAPHLTLAPVDPRDAAWKAKTRAVLHWNTLRHELSLLSPEPSSRMSVFHLERGWHEWGGSLRWSAENPAARVLQEVGANELYVAIHPTPEQIRRFGTIQIVAYVDGQWVGDARIDTAAAFLRGWPVPPVKAASVRLVDFQVTPYHTIPGSPHRFGLPFSDFGLRKRRP